MILQDRSLTQLRIDKYKIMLIFLWLFHVINNYVWLKLDTYPLLWDAAMYFFDSLRFFDLLKHDGFNFIFKIAGINREYSFFVPLIVSVFYNIFGISEDIGVIINGSIFLGVLIFSVYGIAKNIYNKESGLLAAFLITAYPLIFSNSRIFMYDLPLTAMVSLSIYTFQISDNFRNRSISLSFGIILGLGMLTKFPFPLFVTSALLYYSYKICLKIMRDTGGQSNILLKLISEHSSQIINLAGALIIAIILASTWYLPNLFFLLKTLIAIPQVYGAQFLPVFSLQSLSFYFFQLVNFQISFFLFLVFILGLIFFIKAKLENKLFLIYWIVIPYFVFSFIYYKSVRYTLPYLPPIAIVSSIGLLNVQHKKIRSTVIVFIIATALVQFFAYSFGVKFLPSLLTTKIGGNTIFLFNQEGNENALEQHRKPIKENWKTEEILNTLQSFIQETNGSIDVFVIPDDPRIHSPLRSLSYLKKLPFIIHVGSWEHISEFSGNFVITKDGNWLVPPYFMDKINQSVRWFEENIDKFSLIKEINLPDKSNLLIYKRN